MYMRVCMCVCVCVYTYALSLMHTKQHHFRHLRPADIAGFNFHPDTECRTCGEAPIVGWRYICKDCDADLCEACGRAHHETHWLELRKLPPADSTPAHVVTGQKYRVDGIVGRRLLVKAKGERPAAWEYEVRWEGYTETTWEKAADLNNEKIVADVDSALHAQETRRRGVKRRDRARCIGIGGERECARARERER